MPVLTQFTVQTPHRISGNHALLGHVDFGLRARLCSPPEKFFYFLKHIFDVKKLKAVHHRGAEYTEFFILLTAPQTR